MLLDLKNREATNPDERLGAAQAGCFSMALFLRGRCYYGKIHELSDDFSPPEDACTTYRLLFENLEAFEIDLHKHVHPGNNILLPKALHLGKTLTS